MPVSTENAAAPHAVYRCWDATGQLLYVGRAGDPDERWRDHRRDSPWAGEVSRREVVWHPDLETAKAIERAAIREEKPLHNVHGAATEPTDVTVFLSVRVPAQLRDDLRHQALRERRSLQAVLTDAGRAYLAARA